VTHSLLPVVTIRGPTNCPVCGKASYSRSGTHPQCAMEQADAGRKQRLKEERLAAARKAKASGSGTKAWNMKQCPRCKAESHVRKKYCVCGHHFFGS